MEANNDDKPAQPQPAQEVRGSGESGKSNNSKNQGGSAKRRKSSTSAGSVKSNKIKQVKSKSKLKHAPKSKGKKSVTIAFENEVDKDEMATGESFAMGNPESEISIPASMAPAWEKDAKDAAAAAAGDAEAAPKSDFEMLVELMPGHKVDVNRLVFHPRTKVEHIHKEKFSTYVADYGFLIANFFTLMIAIYYVIVGLSVFSYSASIQSINRDDDPANKHAVASTILRTGMAMRHNSARELEMSPATMGLWTMGAGIFQIINVVIGVFGCIQGYKNILVVHMILDLFFLMGELIIGAMMTHLATCDKDDIQKTQDTLIQYIQLYGMDDPIITENDPHTKDKERWPTATFQLDSIQRGLVCCGVLSWADYLNPDLFTDRTEKNKFQDEVAMRQYFLPERITKYELDGTKMIFPASCCRPWWTRNVHCSAGVHLWAHPAVDPETAKKFRQRINQVGCLWRIEQGCQRLLLLASRGILYLAFADIGILIIQGCCVFLIRKKILRFIDIKKKATEKAQKRYAGDTGDESDEVVDPDNEDDDKPKKKKKASKSNIPLPTEDEIELIKARSDFNKFESRVRRTQIGMWMQQARKSVYLPPAHLDHHHHHHHAAAIGSSSKQGDKNKKFSHESHDSDTGSHHHRHSSDDHHPIGPLIGGIQELDPEDIDPDQIDPEELLRREFQKQKERQEKRAGTNQPQKKKKSKVRASDLKSGKKHSEHKDENKHSAHKKHSVVSAKKRSTHKKHE